MHTGTSLPIQQPTQEVKYYIYSLVSLQHCMGNFCHADIVTRCVCECDHTSIRRVHSERLSQHDRTFGLGGRKSCTTSYVTTVAVLGIKVLGVFIMEKCT